MAGSKRSTGSVSPKRGSRETARDNHSPLRFDIASSNDEAVVVKTRILEELERVGFNSHSHFAVKLAIEEALINAIKHGNKLDPKKRVKIEAKISPDVAEITIEDEGPGFDRNSVPDPTLEENLEKCSGRGILLMEAYMNSVKWSNHGRRVKMIKKNEAEAIAS
jgi:serine/threonine-protein kinase RsbW